MKGFVPTPRATVDLMVSRLFFGRRPTRVSSVLDPGCGTGEFIDGILRWCARQGASLPQIVGVESDPRHAAVAREKFRGSRSVSIRDSDFLTDDQFGSYDFIISNPPYVPITGLSEEEKALYRDKYETAKGRFDLYLLFFEQSLRLLKRGGRLVSITPEKFLYVESARHLRTLLARKRIEEIRLVDEQTFGDMVTYPTITTVANENCGSATSVILRDGAKIQVRLGSDGSSWLPGISGRVPDDSNVTLDQICVRISCGVATGADAVFIKDSGQLDSMLGKFAYPTIAGRELGPANESLQCKQRMLVPYNLDGELLPEDKLGRLREYLSQRSIRSALTRRTCVDRKPWYAFHETPPLNDILRPKILCKDITEKPRFWVDWTGKLIPRHSVYYLVPKRPEMIAEICDYLNSEVARKWLHGHCQRAANGFLRLQSHVLKRLPIPAEFSLGPHLRRPSLPVARSPIRERDLKTRRLDFGR